MCLICGSGASLALTHSNKKHSWLRVIPAFISKARVAACRQVPRPLTLSRKTGKFALNSPNPSGLPSRCSSQLETQAA
jgi:hypothetical protein